MRSCCEINCFCPRGTAKQSMNSKQSPEDGKDEALAGTPTSEMNDAQRAEFAQNGVSTHKQCQAHTQAVPSPTASSANPIHVHKQSQVSPHSALRQLSLDLAARDVPAC